MELYTDPTAMAPLTPENDSGELRNLAIHVIENAAKLSKAIHPVTGKAIAEFLRPINSYYSNLIEGHDTHPIDIERALKQDYSDNKRNRSLQLEAKAHIETHQKITNRILEERCQPIDIDFIKWVHAEFYKYLPDEFRISKSREGKELEVVPGELRTVEVEVGRHVAPASAYLEVFIDRFVQHYRGVLKYNDRLDHIIAIAASHHRLAWIHPFLDGNGRVMRLFTDSLFMHEGLDASGLWSMSRGLARNHATYKARLANADLQRESNYDGRGNLSNKRLVEFCQFFLTVAIDQLQYMERVLNIDTMLTRINRFVDLMVAQQKMKTETRFILEAAFLKGEVSKKEVERLTGKSDKTAKAIAESLVNLELLTTDPANRFAPYRVSYPIKFSSVLFPGLYPRDKEVDMLAKLSER